MADDNFSEGVKNSILDQAVYTRGNDGTGISGAVGLKQWAQWKPLAAQYFGNASSIDMNKAPQFFINQITKQGLPVWNNVTNTTADAIQWLIDHNHFGANDLAQAWFDEQTYQGPW